jgi:hypothetical protein
VLAAARHVEAAPPALHDAAAVLQPEEPAAAGRQEVPVAQAGQQVVVAAAPGGALPREGRGGPGAALLSAALPGASFPEEVRPLAPSPSARSAQAMEGRLLTRLP